MITGVVSFILLHAIKWGLDKLSDRTNGAFGYCSPPQAPPGAHDSAEPEEYSVSSKPSAKEAADEPAAPNGEVLFPLPAHAVKNLNISIQVKRELTYEMNARSCCRPSLFPSFVLVSFLQIVCVNGHRGTTGAELRI